MIGTVLEYYQKILEKYAEWREREAQHSKDPLCTFSVSLPLFVRPSGSCIAAAQPQHGMRLKL